MKKSLVFAMAMALGVSATAFAANPFSDLPAGHWAYGAVAKLAAAGVVDGYPDGTFKGDKTMTRYEMAQIVAKALAKGAIGADDKLVSEFADELDNLGVRVAKLEKNADNVKITGNVRASYRDSSGGKLKGVGDKSQSRLRTRLFLTGEVNDNWHYVSMLENNQYFQGENESGDSDTSFQRAYLDGNIGVWNIQAGRFNKTIAEGNVYDNRVDAVQFKVPFDQAYLSAAYGKMASKDVYGYTGYLTNSKAGDRDSVADKFWNAELGGNIGNLDLAATYTKADDINGAIDNGLVGDAKIWTVGANYKAGDFKIGAMYLKGDDDTLTGAYKSNDDDGYVVSLGYKGAAASKPGSWGLFAKYYDQGAPTIVYHTMNGLWDKFTGEGFKGYQVGGNLTLAKNMVAQVEYYDLKGKESDAHARTLWSQMVVTF
ncbi:S-layer homology domain-containing protein [Acidaminococcus massiliensis]|uniref:S-layer homology domain-containing protein n=1 Tax=Acidaminococcus massiliensis TaxID=1852375 RepID=UPI0026DBF852|nr:S-layer homology domain-containing protein [Acidaminococcus massiliensis]